MPSQSHKSTGPDFASIAAVNGLMLLAFGGLMLLPALVDAIYRSPDWRAHVTSAAITSVVGVGILLASRSGPSEDWSVKQTFLLTTTSWIVISLFGALPLIFGSTKLGIVDALFESVSGLTTTGSTVIVGLDSQNRGVLLWRSMLQAIGGLGIIVTAIVVLPFLRIGGLQLFHSESSDRSEKIFSRASSVAMSIVFTYAALTGSCAILYGLTGMSPFDAVNHAMTTISTGGFSTKDASFSAYGAGAAPVIATVFMLAGGMPLLMFPRLARGDFKSFFGNSQIVYLLGIFGLSTGALALWLGASEGMPIAGALVRAAFNVASIITTSGFAYGDYMDWGSFSIVLFFLLIFVGGCTGSTAGGIKIFRFQILWLAALRHMAHLIRPHAVQVDRYGGRVLTEDVIASVLAFLSVFIATIAIVSLALSLFGLDLESSLSAAATAVCNVGPGIGPVIGPSGNFSTLPDGAKLILTAAMLLGRLELFTVLVIFLPAFWRW